MVLACFMEKLVTITFLLVLQLYYEVDESYNLTVPAAGKPVYAHIEVRELC